MKKLTTPQIAALKNLALNAIECAKFDCYAGGWTIEHIQSTGKSISYTTLTILLRLGMIEAKEIPGTYGARTVYRLTAAGEAIVDAENDALTRIVGGAPCQRAGLLREHSA